MLRLCYEGNGSEYVADKKFLKQCGKNFAWSQKHHILPIPPWDVLVTSNRSRIGQPKVRTLCQHWYKRQQHFQNGFQQAQWTANRTPNISESNNEPCCCVYVLTASRRIALSLDTIDPTTGYNTLTVNLLNMHKNC